MWSLQDSSTRHHSQLGLKELESHKADQLGSCCSLIVQYPDCRCQSHNLVGPLHLSHNTGLQGKDFQLDLGEARQPWLLLSIHLGFLQFHTQIRFRSSTTEQRSYPSLHRIYRGHTPRSPLLSSLHSGCLHHMFQPDTWCSRQLLLGSRRHQGNLSLWSCRQGSSSLLRMVS